MTLIRQDMSFALLEALCLFFFLGPLFTVECTETDFAATCNAGSAIEFGTGLMNVSFNPDIHFATDKIFLYLRKEDGQDIIHCGEINKPPPAECKILKDDDDGFTTEGLSGHNLILSVKRATPDLEGEYVLGGYVNGSPVSPTSCYFTVLKSKPVIDDGDSSKRVVTIGVPILVTAFIIVIAVIVFVVFKRRKRERQNLPRPRDEHTAEKKPLAGASPF